MTTTVPRPQDDLYLHVNGEWIAEHEIPADRASDGAFRALRDRSELDVRAIIEDCAAGTVDAPHARQIGDLYASFMDEERVEQLGAEPLAADLDPITNAATKTDLVRVMGELAPTGVGGLFAVYVANDPNSPTEYTTYVWQSGLGLPDEAYYREDQHADTREAYVAHVARLLELAGTVAAGEGRASAERVMAVETALAAGHWDIVATRDADKTNNPMDFDGWQESAGAFDLETWRQAFGRPTAFAHVANETPSFFAAMAEVWESTDLVDLKLWLATSVIQSRAPYLSSDFALEHFDFNGRVMTGAQEIKERWKRGVSLVDRVLSEAVGRVYVDRHFPPAHKERMDHLVDNLLEAYRRSIRELDWMGEETKQKALAKLDTFLPKIGYPETWRDYSALEVSAEDLVGNVRAASRFHTTWLLDKLGTPVDRDEWHMPPQMVNAYYNPTTNEIAFPAAILQPPFFDAGADDAVNYGGIGGVIGHEIGHGFDDQGSKYGPNGELKTWWTDQDRTEFEKRTTSLTDQYDGLVPAQLREPHGDTYHVNGALTIGENIGDLGGLGISLRAWLIELEQRGRSIDDEPAVDGATALQRLFLNWAAVWQEKARDEYLIQRMSMDPHSPDEFRSNQVVKNVDAFHEAFGTGPGDGMWMDPAERVRIW